MTTLAQALISLASVAEAAGADPAQARAEGEALAATVSEPARGAYLDWAEQTGRTPSSETYFETASRGRRYRSAPTPTMAALALARSPHAPAYAAALGEVAQAGAGLGEANPRSLGNAAMASAAQLAPPDPDLPRVDARVEQRPGSVATAPAANPPATPPAEEPVEEPGKSVEELLAELDALVGLREVKAEIHRQAAVLRVEGLRRAAGLDTPTITRHLVFNGNPGTGKTTVARLVAGIYRALGLLSRGQLVEVDRSDLVAGYLGQTAMKTAEVVASAVGGVLFIDEAYSLTGDQYGAEAVDTLVKEMEDKREDLVVIVAGYPVPMALFIAQNPGLESRFRTVIDFADYSDDELVAIFVTMAAAADYDLGETDDEAGGTGETGDAGPNTDNPVLARLRALLAEAERGPTFGNARYVRNLLEAAIGRHAWRLREVESPTVEQLRLLTPEDLADPDSPQPESQEDT
ncbi:AAA family ATPase [Nocardioides sp.]|uniref:AAA family ATPase n=1 Tax=Nocardioides sp. TaxID=35761 RepID=UPI0039E3F9E2